jgi:hypothetical protein
MMEAPSEILVDAPHHLATKWFIPGGVNKVAGDGVPFPVERSKDSIAFWVFVIGSFVQFPKLRCISIYL